MADPVLPSEVYKSMLTLHESWISDNSNVGSLCINYWWCLCSWNRPTLSWNEKFQPFPADSESLNLYKKLFRTAYLIVKDETITSPDLKSFQSIFRFSTLSPFKIKQGSQNVYSKEIQSTSYQVWGHIAPKWTKITILKETKIVNQWELWKCQMTRVEWGNSFL